MSAWGH
jgi:hypothetical protein